MTADEWKQAKKKVIMKMSRKQIEKQYEAQGINDYKLRNLDDLKIIHGIDVREISGYHGLNDEQRELFNKSIINFFNARGLDSRIKLKPKSINYVYEITYLRKLGKEYDDEYESVGVEIFVIKDSQKPDNKLRRLHRYIYDNDVDLFKCKKQTQTYLRFELNKEWYHIENATEWY